LLPIAGARVSPHRADRDGGEGHPGRVRSGHVTDPDGGQPRTRARDERTAYHAGAPPRRRSGGQATGPHMEADSAAVDRYKPRGVTRVIRALDSSIKGLAGAFREEAAVRQELACALLVIPLGMWLGHNGVERALLVA